LRHDSLGENGCGREVRASSEWKIAKVGKG
jgi:hypothetical protein